MRSFNSSLPANSDSTSKRSFNSISSSPSNNTTSGNTNNKKKKSSQKILGMAWGANSRSSSRSSFRNSPFSDFGSYMAVKNRKLQDQFDAEASSSSHSGSTSGKPIFRGISIFVDGFTIPSSQELRGYMLKHGGLFENYFSRHRVTHIICSNLPDSKIKNLRSFSGGLPVVKPSWVLDSVVANKLLSWVPYQLNQLASGTHNQPKLSAFFALKKSPISDDATSYVTEPVKSETEDSSFKGGTVKDTNVSEEDESKQNRRHCSGEFDDSVYENSTGTSFKEPTSSNRNYGEEIMAELSDVATMDESSVGIQPQSSPCRPSASVSSYILNNQNTKGPSSSTTVGPINQRHSTLVDPNFVENYFKNSRLHFIGTWRNRYRKRYPNLSTGFDYASCSLNSSAMSRKTAIIHVDMDCFFVSVVIRNHLELKDKPVAVCHSDNPHGTAEISSANYPARDHGVRAGIFVRDAKALCPHLVIFSYDFKAYEEVADQFYNILHKHCNIVQAVSCDEAFLDVSSSQVEDPQLLASIIRKEIFDTTACTASAGIAGNMLMARLATRTAKPDGQCYIQPEKVDDYLHGLPIKALPGIGHVLEEKLRRKQVKTCGHLRMISKEALQKDFGIKTGDMLWNYSRGIDNRLVGMIQESKSIGAEVNWGVRFNDFKHSQHFLVKLCEEVSLRLQGCGVQGRTFTLKIKKRRDDNEEPIKYMGCGDCENLSHSTTVPMATDDANVLQRITAQLFGSFHIDAKDIRGMGLQVSRLENVDTAKQGHRRNTIRSWLISASTSTRGQCKISNLAKDSSNRDIGEQSTDANLGLCTNPTEPTVQMGVNVSNGEARINQDSILPPLCDLDMGVVESLPPDLFSEINDMYGGKLISFITKNKGRSVDIGSLCTASHERVEGVINEGKRPFLTHLIPSYEIPVDNVADETLDRGNSTENSLLKSSVKDKAEQYKVGEFQEAPVSGSGTSNVVASVPKTIDLMPSSLSQVDVAVLQELPEELRVDILELLPAHRRPECTSDASLGPLKSNPLESLHVRCPENQTILGDSVSSNKLWIGHPPLWVDKFSASNCWMLKTLAEIYYRSGSMGHLSTILQWTISETRVPLGASFDGWDEAISCLCELLKQYIKLKIERDIEEIYVCFCLLRRLSMKSKFFLQLYNIILPHLQASVGENYGGNIHISYVKD